MGFVSLSGAFATELAVLSKADDWRRLLHYEADLFSPTGLKSAIHSQEFFLSEAGLTDPEAELRATLAAMEIPSLPGDEDAHAKCRFPARLLWLQKRFPEHRERLGTINCPAFATWSSIDHIDSISLVFANGYLGNPASYYGHLFLKFNGRKNRATSHLIDQTVNFGAIGTSQDDPLSYIVKGIAGGYDGGFSPVEFYFHNVNYGENELRDLWEYRLDLPADDVRYIVAHAWEVMHKRYTYYFFHDNCAYRVAELLEVVDGIQANPRSRPWIIPQAVLQAISSTNYRGRPLVASKVFHPSRQTRLYDRYVNLDLEQRGLVSAIIDRGLRIDGPGMEGLPLAKQQAVIDTLLDYHQFRNERQKPEGGRMSAAYAEALAARLRLPPGESAKMTKEPAAPDTGGAPSWVQVGVTHYQDGRDTQILRIRPAYYDSLDVSGAQGKSGGLSMGDLQLELDKDRLRIVRLDLIAIDSMNPAVTNLPGDRGLGWKLKAGLEQERLGCTDCLVPRGQGDVSIGSLLGSPDLFGALNAGAAVQGRGTFDGIGFARLGASLVFRPKSAGPGVRVSHEVRRPLESRFGTYSVTSVETRIPVARNYDFRLLLDRDRQYKLSIGIGRYW